MGSIILMYWDENKCLMLGDLKRENKLCNVINHRIVVESYSMKVWIDGRQVKCGQNGDWRNDNNKLFNKYK